jgi:adenylosuccinate synthase
MIKNKLNIVSDAQHGSTGKGAITSYLAWKHKPGTLSTTNMANAGHSAVNVDGEVFVAKALPSASILNKWLKKLYNPRIVIGASAAFDINQLLKEIKECDLHHTQMQIHQRAGVITQEHKLKESGDTEESTKHIASTMQGCGTFLADKILRKPNLKLARDYPELSNMLADTDLHMRLRSSLAVGTILHEGSQGFSLDINHGSHYPQCTSRGTTAMQNLADLGLNHTQLGDVYLVFRPYPIRVGNVIEDGIEKGNSGGCYPDNAETTWEAIADAAGAPDTIKQKELTTVTKRLRRVFTFSKQQLIEAVAVNGATKLAFNFANYIDWSCYGTDQPDRLSQKVMDFIHMVEDCTGVKVALVGTGPQLNHMIEL